MALLQRLRRARDVPPAGRADSIQIKLAAATVAEPRGSLRSAVQAAVAGHAGHQELHLVEQDAPPA
ncbi:MAG TPA: hypothetical protein PLU79_04765, partial [Burkholderiaceae bacterium]|nr:hypothetical protein [Burkholderiaceae bacterium]